MKRLNDVGIKPIGGTRASFEKFIDEERSRLGAGKADWHDRRLNTPCAAFLPSSHCS